MGKIQILKRAIVGEIIKYTMPILKNWHLRKYKSSKKVPIVVTLTSYGTRVNKVLPVTIISILKGKYIPERIVVWLDECKWNNSTIPNSLRHLEKYNVEIKYTKDIKSYTKLIPALIKYPNKVLVTIDDDIYYSSSLLKELYDAYIINPNCIITQHYCYPTFQKDNVCSYKLWKEFHKVTPTFKVSQNLIFPQGFGGILYPPNSLFKDVTDCSLFSSLAPYADDIWFYIMGILNSTPKHYIIGSKTDYYYLDLFRQIFTKDRLHDLNVGESKNDYQLNKVLNYYKISLKDYE